MDVIDGITTRQSIRGFRPEPVDPALLREVIAAACWSPSYKNTQPWEAVVVSGARKEALSAKLTTLLDDGVPPCPDLPEPQGWPATQEARIAHLYARRAEATGIDLADPTIIRKAKKANFHFYGAPHAIYLFQDASLPLWSLFDLGLFTQTLMLAAHGKGLGTVPQAFATDYAAAVKTFLKIPAAKRLVLGLSIGYPDPDSPANRFRTDRAEVAEIVRFLD